MTPAGPAPAPGDKAFLGVGVAFPVQLDATGDLALAAYEVDIRQSVQIILGTIPGERVMRPDFGSGLHATVFEPITTTAKALVRHRVQEALTIWEPRIDTVTVAVDADPEVGRLNLTITYRVRATNTFYNLVYPYYLIEGSFS